MISINKALFIQPEDEPKVDTEQNTMVVVKEKKIRKGIELSSLDKVVYI